MKNLTKLLTLQLRPHVAAMLDAYMAQVQERLPENLRAKVTRSLIIRKLITRQVIRSETLDWLGNSRHASPAVQLRVRLAPAEYDALLARAGSTPYAKTIAALIVEALHPDGNYPPNPEHKP